VAGKSSKGKDNGENGEGSDGGYRTTCNEDGLFDRRHTGRPDRTGAMEREGGGRARWHCYMGCDIE